MKIRTKAIIYGLLAFAPTLTFAATITCSAGGTGSSTLQALCDIINFFESVVSKLIPIFFGLALVYFFWGLAQYVRNAGDPKKAADGKTIMIHGAIAIAVMASIFGIALALENLFAITPTQSISSPTITNI